MTLVRRGLDTSGIDAELELIESGNLYATLAAIAGLPYETDAEKKIVKRDTQMYCLFGPIGWHPLWKALQTISPGICRDIQWWRSQSGGATRLAHFLQRGEGALMTDGLIHWLASGGIPAVQIHDGAIVPAGVAVIAKDWLSQHSRNMFGRSCRVKLSITVPTQSVEPPKTSGAGGQLRPSSKASVDQPREVVRTLIEPLRTTPDRKISRQTGFRRANARLRIHHRTDIP